MWNEKFHSVSIDCREFFLQKKEGEFSGAPERSRTSNRLIRSQILYPVELRVHYGSVYGIRTRDLRLERAMSWATRRTRHVKLHFSWWAL